MDVVLEACEEATRIYDETSVVNHEDQMAGQSSQVARTPFYVRPPHQNESPLDMKPFGNVN